MWKRKRDIEGVSNASIVALKTTLLNEERNAQYKDEIQQQTDRSNKTIKTILDKKQPGSSSKNNQDKSNLGIDERNKKDIEELKDEEERQSYENVQRILIEKAKIYEQLVHGQHEKPLDFLNINNENNIVDFYQKIVDREAEEDDEQKKQQQQKEQQNKPLYEGMMNHPDFERERQRRIWESEADSIEEQQDRKEQEEKEKKIELMMKEQETTKINREKHQSQKDKAQQIQQDRLKQIEIMKKQALLKQKLKQQKTKS